MGVAEGLAPRGHGRTHSSRTAPVPCWTGVSPRWSRRPEASKEQFFAALATGSERFITSPRGDLRGCPGATKCHAGSTAIPLSPKTSCGPSAHGIENGAPASDALPPTAQEWRLRRILTAEDRTSTLRKTVPSSIRSLQPATGGMAFSPGSTATSVRFRGSIHDRKATVPHPT